MNEHLIYVFQIIIRAMVLDLKQNKRNRTNISTKSSLYSFKNNTEQGPRYYNSLRDGS